MKPSEAIQNKTVSGILDYLDAQWEAEHSGGVEAGTPSPSQDAGLRRQIVLLEADAPVPAQANEAATTLSSPLAPDWSDLLACGDELEFVDGELFVHNGSKLTALLRNIVGPYGTVFAQLARYFDRSKP